MCLHTRPLFCFQLLILSELIVEFNAVTQADFGQLLMCGLSFIIERLYSCVMNLGCF